MPDFAQTRNLSRLTIAERGYAHGNEAMTYCIILVSDSALRSSARSILRGALLYVSTEDGMPSNAKIYEAKNPGSKKFGNNPPKWPHLD